MLLETRNLTFKIITEIILIRYSDFILFLSPSRLIFTRAKSESKSKKYDNYDEDDCKYPLGSRLTPLPDCSNYADKAPRLSQIKSLPVRLSEIINWFLSKETPFKEPSSVD